MAEALSIKLRCASWQQLATIYKRDLSRGTMFLKAGTPPPIGTAVRIDLALPSATVIALAGTVASHVNDPQRGAGVELTLEPIPPGTVWLIESALASEQRRNQPPSATSASTGSHTPVLGDRADVSAAEQDLIRALTSEAESLKKLNPFLVLGVGYEASDSDVRAAFGELTKRYHPDRFARYETVELRQLAAEIFILIRDAYRRIGDASARAQVLHSLGKPGVAPRAVAAPPRPVAPVPPPPRSQRIPVLPGTAPPPVRPVQNTGSPPPASLPGPARRASTDGGFHRQATSVSPSPLPPIAEGTDALEAMIDQGRLDEALATYKAMSKKQPSDRNLRAGIELCEGLLALNARDRLEAAQRFETALEIDPSNERAARELADMRRQATNERKGLLSRLMGKKE